MSAPAADKNNRPRNLERWISDLSALLPPVDPVVRALALEELDNGLGGAARVAQILERDPVQALLVLRAANRALSKYGRDAATLEHAISLLGSNKTRAQLVAAPAIDPAHQVTSDYRQALLRSQHAAWQARLWAEGSGRWHPEEIYWATLLAGAPLWMLWFEAGDAMRELELRRARHQSYGNAAQKQLLGATVAGIAAGIARQWLLPEASRASWHRDHAGTPREWVQLARAARIDDPPVVPDGRANDLSHHPALLVSVANALAAESDWDWHSRRTVRLFAVAACACRRPLSTLLDYGHRATAAFSRAAVENGVVDCLPLPASRLLCHWQQALLLVPPKPRPAESAKSPADRPQTNPAATTTTATADIANTSDPALFATAIAQLQQPQLLQSARAALALAPAALCNGAGFQRAAVLLVRQSSRELQTLASAGCEQSPALRLFRQPLDGSPLLTQLLERPLCLTLDSGNRARFLQHLPAALREAAGCDAFTLMAVFADTTPVALLYADAGGTELDTTQRNQFRQLCNQLTTALTQLMKRGG